MLSTLKDISLFQGLSVDEIRLVESLFEPRTCKKGWVFEQGDPARYLYLVLEGVVEIRYKPYDGPPITITRVKDGGVFGWSAIAGNAVYTSGAICEEDCQVVRIQGSLLRSLCVKHPEIGATLLDRLADSVSMRWQDSHSQVRAILSQGVSGDTNVE